VNPDNKGKILIMAGVLVVALAAFGVVFFVMNKPPADQSANPAPPATTQPAPPPTSTPSAQPTPTPGGPMPTTPGQMPVTAAAPTPPPKPTIPEPPAPPTPALPAIIAGLPDPFKGGPPPPPPPKPPPPPPPEVKISRIPSFFATPHGLGRSRPTGSTISAKNLESPVGRHAGWIYNSNGQVVAIFEDNDGTAKAVRVGDEFDGFVVKVITPEYLLLKDQDGKEIKVPLQGTDSYLGKSRAKDVEVTPKMPNWPN
jgi:hypothetical protein